MNKLSHGIVFAAAMVITIVLVDVLFFRHHAIPRLLVNVGIFLVSLVFYWRLFKHN